MTDLYETTNWGLYEGEPDDPESYITKDGKCSNCGEQLDFDSLAPFEVEESGVQPGTVHGPAVHWAYGVWVCPNCGARLPFETSS